MSTHALLREHGLRPRKSLGQHFLTSEGHLQRIATAANLTPEDVVLEIGPGLGSLTRHLADRAGQVVAVELDAQLIPALHDALADRSNVIIIHGDILQIQPSDLLQQILGTQPGPSSHPSPGDLEKRERQPGRYKVVANLPFYITSAVLRHLLETPVPPQLMVLTVQREVGERLCAVPPNMSLLAVSVQFYAEPELVARIPAGAFHPPPKVDSAVVRLWVRSKPAVAVDDVEGFFRVVRAGFGQRRKQLRNALAHGLHLNTQQLAEALLRAGVDARRRAETLTLEEWGQLHQELARLEATLGPSCQP
jgi:16S rRNA (adenine1518-N6/adenine1519-N6)-dimethyltransferase